MILHLHPSLLPFMEANMETITSSNTDWTNVLPELLHLITRKLNDLPDFIRFRAVCISWWRSSPISDPPPHQVPWILEKRPYPYESDHFRFFSPISQKIYEIPFPHHYEIPSPHHLNVQGPTLDGYLLIHGYHHTELSLINPLTHHAVHLKPFEAEHSRGRIYFRRGNYVFYNKECIDDLHTHAIYHLGDNRMHKLLLPEFELCTSWSQICHNGMYLYIDSRTGVTWITSIATSTLICVVPSPKKRSSKEITATIFLVESFGEILMVKQIYFCRSQNCNFNIYKLNFGNENKNPYWVKIDSIGDCILFLSTSVHPHATALEASLCPGLRGNSIYFRNYLAEVDACFYRYDILDGEYENMACSFRDWDVFVPSLRYLKLNNSSPQ